MTLASPCFGGSSAPIPVNNPAAQQNGFIDLLALMSGHCKTLKVAGRTFACKTVAYAHGDADRTVGLDIHTRPLARQVPGARLTILPGIGHMLHQVATDACVAVIADTAGRA